MITPFFQQYYTDLKDKGDYVSAFAVLRKNPEILDLDHENIELAQQRLRDAYDDFKGKIDESELKTGLTYILRQSMGASDLEFTLAA